MVAHRSNFTSTFLMRYTYYFFKVIGLAPVSFQTRSIKLNQPEFTISKLSWLHNFLLILFVVVFNYFSSFIAYKHTLIVCFDRMIDSFRTVFAVTTTVYILIIYCISQKKIILIANKLKNYKYLLSLNDDLWLSRRNYAIIGLTWFSVILLTPTAQIYSKAPLSYLSVYLCDLIISSMLIQCSILLNLMKKFAKTVNEYFFHVLNHRINFDVKMGKITYLCKLYSSICETTEELFNFYSILMFISIAYLFTSLTFYTYYMTTPILIDRDTFSLNLFAHCFIQITNYVVALMILTKSVSAFILEVRTYYFFFFNF